MGSHRGRKIWEEEECEQIFKQIMNIGRQIDRQADKYEKKHGQIEK